MAGDEDLHAGFLALAVGAVGEHGGAARGEKTPGVVGDGVVGARRSQRPLDRVRPDDQPAPEPTRVGMRDDGGDGGRAMPADVVGDSLQLGKSVAGHRLCEAIDHSAAGEADGECVVVGYPVAMQFGSPALDHLVGEFVNRRLDTAPGHRARDRAVGSDDHGGAGRTRRGLDRADDGGDARCPARSPDREQIVEYITHTESLGTPRRWLCERSALSQAASNSMGSSPGPLIPTIGFHGAGPARRRLRIRRAMTIRASAISRRARFAPRQ